METIKINIQNPFIKGGCIKRGGYNHHLWKTIKEEGGRVLNSAPEFVGIYAFDFKIKRQFKGGIIVSLPYEKWSEGGVFLEDVKIIF